MPLTGDFRTRSIYITIFLLLLISYFLIFYSLQQFVKQSRWVENSNHVITNLENLLVNLNEGESSVRGYMIQQDTAYLQTFYSGTRKIDSLLKNVNGLIADNREQQKNWDTLQSLVQSKLGRMYRSLLLFKDSGNLMTSYTRMSNDDVRDVGKHIQQVITKMEKEEEDLLRIRKNKQESVFLSVKIVTITSSVIALLLFVYSIFVYTSVNKGRFKAKSQAELYRQQLEKKVAELQEVNHELQELRQQEKFNTTGRIARTIAHEIRNPLTNIGLATDQVKDIVGKDPELNMLLDMITRNAGRINQMITQLLTSTRFSQLNQTILNINTLVDETLELASDRFKLKNIKLEKRYVPSGCDVEVDIEKIKIALLNIIINAIESMKSDEGELVIETKKEKDKCTISIKDNGAGMDAETQQKIFDPYFSTKAKGNGLGLTLTQNIILNHKGTINVTSKEGEGTTFTVCLNAV